MLLSTFIQVLAFSLTVETSGKKSKRRK